MSLKQIVIEGKGIGLNGKNTLIFDNCLVRFDTETELIFNYDDVHSGITSVAKFDKGYIQKCTIKGMEHASHGLDQFTESKEAR